jgi:hypothetical protein
MNDRRVANVNGRSREGISAQKPRWGFWKGMLTGVAIEVPALTATVWVLAQLGIGNADVPAMRIMRLTTVFAGVAALFTAGGIGRLSAYASIDGGRRRAMFVAARAHAAASAGLVLIAAIPHGQLPGRSLEWLAFPAAGLVTGAACGILIGFVCGGTAPVELADVWSLARRPSEALRSWLDPRELVRLGAAVRHRTTNLFEGMFDPAPPPPMAPPTAGSAADEPTPGAPGAPPPPRSQPARSE